MGKQQQPQQSVSNQGPTPPLDRIYKVNVVGGKGQVAPVEIVLASKENHIEEQLSSEPFNNNFWTKLKQRPQAFNDIRQLIKNMSLRNEKDIEDFIISLETDHRIYKRFQAANGEELGIKQVGFASLTEAHKSEIRAYLVSIRRKNIANGRFEYGLLKQVVTDYVTRKFTRSVENFNTLERALSVEQLDYIQKMYEVFGLNETNAVPSSMIELIWSYWMEEGMLAQSMYAISRRFQNMRNGDRDPLVNLTIDPLRGASNLLWGYIQDAPHRLTVQRRSYEYENQYGLRLFGSAIPASASADSRSKFIGAFNNLLIKCGAYYKQTDNLTVKADAFPVLNALQELHLILAEGANNQFGSLTLEARIEMMVEQQILAREEIREFLNSRPMVPYKEEWMGRVDALKKLQRWDPTGVTHFYDLATYGELIVLSIRYITWMDVNASEIAGKWAVFFRNEIQKYIFSYRTVTGVDLSSETASDPEARNTIPALLIRQKTAY